MPIFTVGYQQLTVAQLGNVISAVDAHMLVDVRSIPNSRKAGFNRRQLEAAFPRHYRWEGHHLGGMKPGKPGTTPAGLNWLACTQDTSRRVLLLCVCQAPGNCHRHVLIAKQMISVYGIDCRHIFQDHMVRASELDRSIRDDDDYKSEPFPPKRSRT